MALFSSNIVNVDAGLAQYTANRLLSSSKGSRKNNANASAVVPIS